MNYRTLWRVTAEQFYEAAAHVEMHDRASVGLQKAYADGGQVLSVQVSATFKLTYFVCAELCKHLGFEDADQVLRGKQESKVERLPPKDPAASEALKIKRKLEAERKQQMTSLLDSLEEDL